MRIAQWEKLHAVSLRFKANKQTMIPSILFHNISTQTQIRFLSCLPPSRHRHPGAAASERRFSFLPVSLLEYLPSQRLSGNVSFRSLLLALAPGNINVTLAVSPSRLRDVTSETAHGAPATSKLLHLPHLTLCSELVYIGSCREFVMLFFFGAK